MFFNYDLFELLAVAFIAAGAGILTFFICKSWALINNESLVNSNSKTISS